MRLPRKSSDVQIVLFAALSLVVSSSNVISSLSEPGLLRPSPLPKGTAGGAGSGGLTLLAPTPTPGEQSYQPLRQFVYGPSDVDELVWMRHWAWWVEWCVLRDAYHNVIAYVFPYENADTECDYDPYGKMRVGDTTPAPNQSQLDMEYNPVNNNTAFADLMGKGTLWYDREAGHYHNRHRTYRLTCPGFMYQLL